MYQDSFISYKYHMQEIHSYWNKSVYVKNINYERKIHSQNEHVYGFNVIMTPVASIN